jgi:2-polyprenyl-3-methyl-5-hydroxy-6-metoxy-1,4-benzoquinol methylase
VAKERDVGGRLDLSNSERDLPEVDRQTIEDFGNQWTRFDALSENICSRAQLVDHCGPVFDIDELKGARVLDIGSGSGCVVKMLVDAEARHVTAVEPSKAMLSCKANTAAFKDRIEYVQVTGDQAPLGNFDVAISLGVIHHIRRPDGVMRRVSQALKPGGAFIVWVYGYEGNEIYLAIMDPLRKLTQRLPDTALNLLCYLFALALSLYTFLCRALPLPMAPYMRAVIARQTLGERILTIFDQLNPAYAKYYRREEILQLFNAAGFCDIQCYHRHGYSWTVVGRRHPMKEE